MTPRRLAALALVPLLAACTLVWAGAREEVVAASKKFLALRSYQVDMTHSDKRVPPTKMSFVAPDRYRMESINGTQLVIGDTMYMQLDGRTMRIPMPKGMLTQWRQTDVAMREVDKTTIEGLGSEPVNGKAAKKYRLTRSDTNNTTLMWVGADGNVLKVETTGGGKRPTTTTLVYSRWNDPALKIDTPK
jgi:outer membrane lipoprotein-sorting protein